MGEEDPSSLLGKYNKAQKIGEDPLISSYLELSYPSPEASTKLEKIYSPDEDEDVTWSIGI